MLITLFAALITQAAPATPLSAASNSPAAVASSPAAPRGDEEKMVCRREQETGSLMAAKKVCHPQSVWDQMSRDAQDTLNATTRIGVRPHG